MHEQIRLVIVTDNPDEAVADAFCCAMTNKPRWARIVSDPMEILHLPNGTKVRGLWYSSRARTSAAEYAWRERRLAGGLQFLTAEDEEDIAAWILHHKERMRAQIDSRQEAVMQERESVLPHPEPEIQNLVLSQRWV